MSMYTRDGLFTKTHMSLVKEEKPLSDNIHRIARTPSLQRAELRSYLETIAAVPKLHVQKEIPSAANVRILVSITAPYGNTVGAVCDRKTHGLEEVFIIS